MMLAIGFLAGGCYRGGFRILAAIDLACAFIFAISIITHTYEENRP